MMAGSSNGERCTRSVRSTSRPVSPGIIQSSSSRSTACFSSITSASGPEAACSTS